MRKVILIVGPILVLIASGIAVAYFGIVNVPGVTPVKKWVVVPASKDPTGGLLWTVHTPIQEIAKQADGAAKASEKAAQKAAPPTEETTDPSLGDAKLANLWNDLEIDQLEKITEKWQPAALAKVLAKMDGDQVTKYLDTLDPTRADAICRAIQILASKAPSPKSTL